MSDEPATPPEEPAIEPAPEEPAIEPAPEEPAQGEAAAPLHTEVGDAPIEIAGEAPSPTALETASIEPTLPMETGTPRVEVEALRVEKKPQSRARRRLLYVLVPLLALGIGAALGFDPLLRWLVDREARRFGITLEYQRISLRRSRVDLGGVRVQLAGVSGMRTEITTVSAQIEGLRLKAVEAEGVMIALEGSAADRLLELGSWSSDSAAFFQIPGSSTNVRITWIASPGEAAWLDLTRGSLSASVNGAVFHSPSAALLGVPVGAIGAAWAADGSTLSIGLGKETLAEAPIRVDLHPAAKPPTGDVTLKSIKLQDLGAPLGLSLPAPGAAIEGTATLTMGGGKKGSEVIDGTLSMLLSGWVPPHPRELDAIVYGNRTTFSTAIHINEDRSKLTLSETTVTAGSFKLKGGGTVDRREDHAVAVLDLKGSLACADVVRSAALSNLGSFLGKMLGDVARPVVRGTVGVSVHLEADTRDLKGAKIKQDVGVGCGLRLPTLF
ncbi:MAG: hypothetical protein ABI193_10150 [Minicystis sp.]